MLYPSQFRGFHLHAEEFTTAGTHTFIKKPGIDVYKIILVAGGGGGYSGGGNYPIGGGGGEVTLQEIVLTDDAEIIIGAGGAAANMGEDSILSVNNVEKIRVSGGQGNSSTSNNANAYNRGGGSIGVRAAFNIVYVGGGRGGSDYDPPEPGIASAGADQHGGGGSLGKGGTTGSGILGGGGAQGQAGGDGYCMISWVA